jgi:hypothetical protein
MKATEEDKKSRNNFGEKEGMRRNRGRGRF